MNNSPNFRKQGQSFSRRQFIKHAAGAAGVIAISGEVIAASVATKNSKSPFKLPPGPKSGIEHIVVVMMENRSFDHFLGWLPGADGRQSGLLYRDAAGITHPTFPLAPDYQGCDHPGPDHSYEGGRVEYNHGACDGWLRAGENDIYSIGYYTRPDLSFLGNAAPAWTTFDGYFAAIMAETFPNRIYQHAAQTDRLTNTSDICTLPTIWDRLADAGLTGRYYFSDVPFLALWGAKYLPICRPLSTFLEDCAAGTLPHVSFVDPRFLGEEQGLSNDDHPHADIRNGEAFLNKIYDAVTTSPNWSSTVMVINYDEWGGFFDHVPPTPAHIPPADRLAGNKDGLRGFRVPALIVSPWSPRATVAHGLYDHTSVLKMIEWRWQLDPLTVRDATANNMAEVLDLTRPNLDVPRFTVPSGPFLSVCLPGASELENEMAELAALAQSLGFTLF